MTKKYNYPLLRDAFNSKDINEGIKVLKSRFITMSKNTDKFEKYYKFAVTTKRSRYTKDQFNEYLLPRVSVNKNDSLIKFFLKIKTPYEDIKYKND